MFTVQLLTKKNYENTYNQIHVIQIHGFLYLYGMLSKCVQLTYGEVEKATNPTCSLLMLFTFGVELLRVNVTCTTLQIHVQFTCISSAPSLESLDRLSWKQMQTVIVPTD